MGTNYCGVGQERTAYISVTYHSATFLQVGVISGELTIRGNMLQGTG